MSKPPKSKNVHASGKRKRAIARVTVTPGNGLVSINGVALQHYGNELNRARVREPLMLAGETATKHNFLVRAVGGGVSGQADAIRLAIGRTLVQIDGALKEKLLDYDRQLLVADIRRKESAKPNSHGQARSKTQKSYR